MTLEETIRALIPKDIPELIMDEILESKCPSAIVNAIGERRYKVNGSTIDVYFFGPGALLRGYSTNSPK